MKIHLESADYKVLDATVKTILQESEEVTNIEVLKKNAKGLFRRRITCGFLNVSKLVTLEVPAMVNIFIVSNNNK